MNAERIGSLVWMLFGVATIYGSLDLGLGELGQPGSGFLACVAGCFVILMAVIIFMQSYRGDQAAKVRVAELWVGVKWQRTIAITVLIALFISVFELLGFFLCSFALLVVIMKWLEGLSWKVSIFVPAITILGTFLLFKTVLKISLPVGVLGF